MSDSLSIQIDVSAAKAALDTLRKSFDGFSSGVETGVAKASSAVQRLNTAMQGLKAIDASKSVDSLTRLNQAMSALANASGLKGLASELRSLALLDVSKLELQLRSIGAALRSIQPPPGLQAMVAQLRQLGSAATTTAGQLTSASTQLRTFDSGARSASNGLGVFSSGLGSVRNLLAGFGAALGAAGFAQFVSGAKSALESSQGLKNTLTSLTGSATQTQDAMKWVDDMAKRLSINIGSARDGFKQFSASVLASGKDMDTAKTIFENMSVGIASLNLGTDKAKLIFNALSQMMSKGTISAEELKQQLGDSMPGAIGLMSKAVGVGTAELLKMMEQGKLSSDQLVKFSEIVKNQYAAGLTEALNSPLAALRNFSNSMLLLQERFGKGFFDALASGVNTLSQALQMDSVLQAIETVGSALGQLASGFMTTFGAAIALAADVVNGIATIAGKIGDAVTWIGQLMGVMDATQASTTNTVSALKIFGIVLGGLVIVGTIAAGVWALSTAIGAVSAAATVLSGALLRLTALSGPWGLALGVGIAALALLAGHLLKTDDAAKKQADTIQATTQAQTQFAGSTDDLKDKMAAVTSKADDFVEAQTKLKEGFTQVEQSATKLPGPLGQVQDLVGSLNDPLAQVAKSSGTLGLMLESMTTSLPGAAAGLTTLTESSGAAIEPLGQLVAQLQALSPPMQALALSSPAVSQALSSMSVPDLAGFAANVTTLANQATGLDQTKTALGEIVTYLNEASPALASASSGVERLAIAGTGLASGFNAATEAGSNLVSQMSSVESGAASLEAQMRALESAARDALRAAQAAQSSSSSSSEIGSGRYGGLSQSLPESLTAPLDKFKSAPQFAEGTANTSRSLSKLPGGGIPSILHPNEAVIPLSRGRKVPVDLNLALMAPAQQATQSLDLAPTARALELVAASQTDIASALADDRSVTVRNEWNGGGFTQPSGNQFVGSFGNPADLSMRGSAAGGGGSQSQRADSPSATSATGSGVTVVIAEGAIQVHASDLDGFKRSEDQLARGLADKIKRATRRVQ
ncbi:MAG: tape measure protein [Hyphomicrobiaceae bacterium]|nr:tape measure protein [Hyphomicrobiaceae bacterium]